MLKTKIYNLFKKIKAQTMNISEGHRLFAFYCIGIAIGTFIMNIFGRTYADEIGIYGQYITTDIQYVNYEEFDKGAFFIFCIRKYTMQFLFILFLNFFINHKLINGLLCAYKGILSSILICSATIVYGAGGILIFCISIFPHYFLYVPMFVYSMYLTINIKKDVKNKKIINKIIKGCIIEAFLIVGTSFLEVYINLGCVCALF